MRHTDEATDPRRELERRMGLEPLDELLAERHALVAQAAALRARYGPFGTWNDLRKVELARIAGILRAQAVRDEVKVTEAALEEAAHADARYADFVLVATQERAEWTLLEDKIQGITDRIMRDQALARFVAAEVRL